MPVTASTHQMLANSTTPEHRGCGCTLVSTGGQRLPLRSARLSGCARGGMARVVLEQVFHNPHPDPLRVSYQLPLPENAAVTGFSFRIGAREIAGVVDSKQRARDRFEEAIAEGRTAAHLEQERSTLFAQQLGNIPPATTVVARIEIDQPLTWVPDAGGHVGGWEWRFPTVLAPRYLGEAGRVPDAKRVSVEVSDRPRAIAMSMQMAIADEMTRVATSPSHQVVADTSGRVTLADGSVGLDRDVVLRWGAATPAVGLSMAYARPALEHAESAHMFGLVTLVPPSTRVRPVARDLVVLLDTSGSMHGRPLAQAKRITGALVDGLQPGDTLELIEFSNTARRFDGAPREANDATKAAAHAWLQSLRASGGTEMVSGILAALDGVRDEAQRQVVVITDGQIGFEQDVVSAILERLPNGSRLHAVGVGSAVNRSLTGPAARAGRGLEVVVGVDEDPERAACRLLTRTQDPLVVDVTLTGSALLEHAPLRLPDLYAGGPALASVRLAAHGGELMVRGRTAEGRWEATATVRSCPPGEGSAWVVALFARQRVEDLELSRAAGADKAQTDALITDVGLRYQIATRMTSWLAISDRRDVDPGDPTRQETIPQELPYGMSVAGVGLRGGTRTGALRVGVPMGAPAAPRGLMQEAGGSLGGGVPGDVQRENARGVISRSVSVSDAKIDGYIERDADDAGAADTFCVADEKSEASSFIPVPPVPGQPAKRKKRDSKIRRGRSGRARGASSGGVLGRQIRQWFLGKLAADGLALTLRSRQGGRWVLDLTGPDQLRWWPEAVVVVKFGGGHTLAAHLVPGTTRDGVVDAGNVVRLVLELDEVPTAEPSSLELIIDGTRVEIPIVRG